MLLGKEALDAFCVNSIKRIRDLSIYTFSQDHWKLLRILYSIWFEASWTLNCHQISALKYCYQDIGFVLCHGTLWLKGIKLLLLVLNEIRVDWSILISRCVHLLSAFTDSIPARNHEFSCKHFYLIALHFCLSVLYIRNLQSKIANCYWMKYSKMPLVVLYFAFWRIIIKILVWIDLFSTLIWPKGPPFKIHKLRVVCRRMLRQSFVLKGNQNFIHRTHFSSQQMKTQINLIIQKLHILRDAFGIYAYMCVSFHSKHKCTAKALKIELKSTCLVKVFVIFRWCSSTTKIIEINNNIVRINGSESFSLFPSIQNILRSTKTICSLDFLFFV